MISSHLRLASGSETPRCGIVGVGDGRLLLCVLPGRLLEIFGHDWSGR